MSPHHKPLVILGGAIKTPPLSETARRRIGQFLRSLQRGEVLGMPHSRPMPVIGQRCHELRVLDTETGNTWRVMYCVDADAVVVLEAFAKKTQATPKQVIELCQKRLRTYRERTGRM